MHTKLYIVKRIFYTSCFLLASELLFGQGTSVQQENYIAKYSSIAVEEMNKYGIPASITLAQGILESAAGTAELATEANNHFGIKCHDWKGDTYHHDDDQKQECFRKYDHAEQSFEDHSTFLTTRERYASLFDLKRTDYQGWAHGLKKAGYATDPNYPKRLIDIIERYELYKYDTQTSTKSKVTYLTENKKENTPPKTTKSPSSSQTSSASKPSTVNTSAAQKSTQPKVYQSEKMMGQISPYHEHTVKTNNGVKYIVAQENDSYESIAEEFALKTNEIYAINDAPKGTRPQAGEIVYIRAKKNTASRAFHVVQPDETMRDIAQKYGIRLSALYKKNNIKEGVRPLIGQRLKLK